MKTIQLLLLSLLLVSASGASAFEPSIPEPPDPDPGPDNPLPSAEPDGDALPEVLTASRLRQPKARTPGTVTILEGDMLRALGVLNLWDAFRLVPGMTVGYTGSNNPVVTYHGTVAVEQRRLQVLVDGRSYYNASLADVDWNNMPVPIQEIERIEVTRGPNAATYGANSFLAVINIETRSPQDTHGIHARAAQGLRGDDGYRDYYGSAGGRNAGTDWRLSANMRRTDGFDYRSERELGDDGSSSRLDERKDARDGFDLLSLNLSTQSELTAQDEISIRAGYHDVFEEEDPTELASFRPSDDPDITGEDWYGSLRWDHRVSTNHFFHVKAYYQSRNRRQSWRANIDERIFPDLAELPVDELQADLNDDLKDQRTHVEFQETRIWSPRSRAVYGASYREERYESDTFFNGTESSNHVQVFANLERGLTSWLTANVGAMWEDDSDHGTFFSPRGAANIHLTPNQTLRLVFSKAHRLPDAFESKRDWQYRPANVSPEQFAEEFEGERQGPRVSASNPEDQDSNNEVRDLGSESIISREISYLVQQRRGQSVYQAEARIFRDSLSNLLSGRTNIDNWDLENAVDITQKGFELEASADLPRNMLRISYAYLDSDSEYSGEPGRDPEDKARFQRLEQRMNARHSGSLAWIHRLTDDATGSMAYYVTDSLRDRRFERLDLRLAKSFHLPQSTLEVAGVLQHYLNDEPIYRQANNYSDRNHVYAEVSVRF